MTTPLIEAKRILAAIYEKTDMMLNAILVDQFEVFEHNLDLRGKLIEAYEAQKVNLSAEELTILGGEVFKNLSDMDLKITEELNRYKEFIRDEHLEMQKQKNQLTTNVKKTNKYHQATESDLSGHRFDKQK